MQTTLLGLGIAIILALVAALVGPHFVDWSSYRAGFERQATSLAGAPVRIAGPIDARLLPTPSLRLHGVEIDAPNGPVRARDAFVEFSLAALIRGEYRASEVRIAGLEAAAGIDEQGRFAVNFPPISGEAAAIERLRIDDGRVVLTDARAGARLEIEEAWFGGDLKSLAGPLKGEGGGVVDGRRFGYRVALGRAGDDGVRLRLTVEPVGQPLTADLDGSIKREGAALSFSGAATLAQLPLGDAEPWKISGRVRADAASIVVEQAEFEYGAAERALKLGGAANLELGRAPHADVVISARQIDLDRLTAGGDRTEPPLAAVRRFADAFARAAKPPLPVRAGVAIEQVTLAGAPLQTLRGDIESTDTGWRLTGLDFRAPGNTQFHASGDLRPAADALSFAGAFALDAAEPRLLTAWLEGRRAQPGTRSGALRASGEINLSPHRVSIERLRADVDRKAIEGRIAWFEIGSDRTRLEADLRAAELDIDALQALAKATGIDARIPDEIALAADIGSATVAGVEIRGAKTKFRFDADGFALESLSIADIAGANLAGRGNVGGSWAAPRGALTLDFGGGNLDGLATLLSRTFPPYAEALHRLAPQLAPAKVSVGVNIETTNATRVTARIDGGAGALRVAANLVVAADPRRWAEAAIETSGRLESDDARSLARLLAAERLFDIGAGKGLLAWTATGPAQGDLVTQVTLVLPGLDGGAQGKTRVTADGVFAILDIRAKAANAPAFEFIATRKAAQTPLVVAARVSSDPQRVVADALAGSLADAKFSGRLSFMRDLSALDGRIETDDLNLSALLAATIGAPAAAASETWSSRPFTRRGLGGVDATLDLRAKRAMLAPGFDVSGFQARVRLGETAVAFDDIAGSFAGGVLKASLVAPASPLGTAAELRLALTGANAAAFFPATKVAPMGGRLSLLLEAKGAGQSLASVIASLSGGGTISFERPEVAALDPRTFDVVERTDEAATIDAGKLRTVVEKALPGGPFRAARADAAVAITAGQVRLSGLMARGEKANLTVGGGIDLVRRFLDLRLTLYTDGDETAGRPEINVLLRGPLAAPERTVDVSALVGWLALRAVDRQAKRLEALEAERAAAEAALPRARPASDDPSTAQQVPAEPPTPGATLPERLPPAVSPPRRRSLFDLFGASR